MRISPSTFRARIQSAQRQAVSRLRSDLRREARKIESQSRGRIKITIR